MSTTPAFEHWCHQAEEFLAAPHIIPDPEGRTPILAEISVYAHRCGWTAYAFRMVDATRERTVYESSVDTDRTRVCAEYKREVGHEPAEGEFAVGWREAR